MGGLLLVLAPLGAVNHHVLRVARGVGALAVGLMVVAILIQVFYRYILNNALPWPDEAARFCMLWMAGLMAPTAFRQGGFVAIDMLVVMLPRVVGGVLNLLLLLLSLLVLVVAVKIGWGEVTGFGGRFATAALYVPTSFDFSEVLRVPRSWMMSSLFVGVILLTSVNIELILRTLVSILGGEDRLTPIVVADAGGAE
ncbi:TRAP transporter small permease [Pacificibacter marinus]|uniref:TRAP transporter small permease n=1 Tax=Pacificibacter marinus TaxID=658057 RepID=UPI001C06C9F3|nr:TRAP transporter small permease [Pacificibacter marinus]